jgi:hypothetical protein
METKRSPSRVHAREAPLKAAAALYCLPRYRAGGALIMYVRSAAAPHRNSLAGFRGNLAVGISVGGPMSDAAPAPAIFHAMQCELRTPPSHPICWGFVVFLLRCDAMIRNVIRDLRCETYIDCLVAGGFGTSECVCEEYSSICSDRTQAFDTDIST